MAALKRWRGVGALALVAIVTAIVLPAVVTSADLDRTAAALTLAGPAVGAALTLAAGRPNLAVGALAGAGAYVSGALAVRGVDVPLAVAVATAATAAAGAVVAAATARLDVVALLAATLLFALVLSALTQALPQLSGGQAGLGPLPPLGTTLPGGAVLHLTAAGDLHAALAAAVALTSVAVILLSGPRGARWRAVGSDRSRSLSSGLRPLRVEITVMAIAGGVAGLGGALGAHITNVATPVVFAPDVVALPLLAALLAGRGRALEASLAGIGTGIAGGVILPDLGWRGPPSATSLALALLAVAVVISLIPGAAVPSSAAAGEVDAEQPWPLSHAEFSGSALTVDGLEVRAGPLTILRGVSFRVAPGQIHGLVGPNGAGKSTLLSALATARSRRVGLDPGIRGPIVLQPQSGGGFPACTVDETLLLAAAGGGRDATEAHRAAEAWRSRLGLDQGGGRLCADLSHGRRRLLDLARVLLRRPAVLLCDEPLAGLDAGMRAAAVSLLRAAAASGLTVVLAEHDRGAVAALAASTTELTGGDAPASVAEPAT